MQTRSQRGRTVRSKSKQTSARLVYIALALIAVIGITIVVVALLPDRGPAVDVGGLDTFPSKGSPDAPVTVVEYADFQCPGCANYATTLGPQIDQEFVETGQVRFIFHEMPLTQHRNAVPAAEAGRCAADQNAFWEMHDLLFANQAQWSQLLQPRDQFVTYALQLGLDRDQFEQCVDNGTHRPTILAAQQQAFANEIPATPSFVIDGQVYQSGQLRGAIQSALAAQGQ